MWIAAKDCCAQRVSLLFMHTCTHEQTFPGLCSPEIAKMSPSRPRLPSDISGTRCCTMLSIYVDNGMKNAPRHSYRGNTSGSGGPWVHVAGRRVSTLGMLCLSILPCICLVGRCQGRTWKKNPGLDQPWRGESCALDLK